MEPRLDAWGVYVHVPFCPRRCTYCDFAIAVGKSAEERERYVQAVLREWQTEQLPAGEPLAVYLGGGTPSMLSPAQVEQILQAIRLRSGGVGVEVTLEVNPETVDLERLRGFRRAGVTRISIGAQAMQDHHLAAMHRGHRAADVALTVTWARAAGFDSISVDAIYGWPGQTLGEWQETVRGIVAINPDHLSLYQLQVEPETALSRMMKAQIFQPVDLDLTADMADWAESYLIAEGYDRYEISSYARPGHSGQLNRLYWTMNTYVAVGMGAHSFNGTRRWWNVRAFPEYLARISAGHDPEDGAESLPREAQMREYAWLGLRTVQGFSRSRFYDRFGQDPLEAFLPVWLNLNQNGLLAWNSDRIWLQPRGLDLANQVMAALIDAAVMPPVSPLASSLRRANLER